MKLYICYGPGGASLVHSCAKAYETLVRAGYEPEVTKVYGLGRIPGPWNHTKGREEVKRLSGDYRVPTLVLGDDTAIKPSSKIIDWAKSHPAVSAK